MTGADDLRQIMRDLDRAMQAWQDDDYPHEGPLWDAKEAAFVRLHEWHVQHGERS